MRKNAPVFATYRETIQRQKVVSRNISNKYKYDLRQAWESPFFDRPEYFWKYSMLAKRSEKNTILRENNSTPVIVRVGTAFKVCELCSHNTLSDRRGIYENIQQGSMVPRVRPTDRDATVKRIFSNKIAYLFLSFSWISVGMKLKNENWSGARTACNVPVWSIPNPTFHLPFEKERKKKKKITLYRETSTRMLKGFDISQVETRENSRLKGIRYPLRRNDICSVVRA